MAPKHWLHVMFVMACNLLEVYIVLSLPTCCAFTHLILIIQKSVMFIAFVYACIFKNVNKLDSGMRMYQNTWGRVSQAWKRDYERDKEVQSSCSILGFQHGCWQICRKTPAVPMCMCSGFPAGRSEQMIMTSFCDVMRISYAIEGGNYKRRAWPSLRTVVAVIWVFRY